MSKRTIIAAALALMLTSAPAIAQLFPPGTALPPPGTEEAAVLAPINAVFAAFATGDAKMMLEHVFPDGRVSAPGKGESGGVRQQSWTQFAQQIKPGSEFQESISDPAIEIDGDIAMVWARFVVRSQGRVANCGYDHFDLVRENGKWRIMNLTFSSNLTSCAAH